MYNVIAHWTNTQQHPADLVSCTWGYMYMYQGIIVLILVVLIVAVVAVVLMLVLIVSPDTRGSYSHSILGQVTLCATQALNCCVSPKQT